MMNEFDGLEKFIGLEKDKRKAKRRKTDYAKALRKQNISRKVYGFDWYKNLHSYSKNKVHCSCMMCRFKSVWEPDNKPMQDVRNELSMKEKELEYACGL